MSEYTEEEQYQARVAQFNASVINYTLLWSNYYQASSVCSDKGLGVAEVWFQCPICDNTNGAENMYLLQRNTENGRVVMQNLSTFYDLESDGEYSGVEAIFDLGVTVVVMACRECVTKDGYDPDSVEIIEPDYKESLLV